MKGAFFHDHVMKENNGNFYSNGGLPYKVFRRYLTICDSLIVSTRVEKVNEETAKFLVMSSGEQVQMQPIKNYKTVPDYIINNAKIKKEIRNIISSVDIVIVRLPSILGSMAFYEAKKLNKNCIVEVVGCAWDALMNYGKDLKGKILAPYMFFRTKRIVKNAKNVIYVTEKFLQKRYPTKGNNIGCSNVNLEKVDEKILEERIQKIKNLDNNKKIMIGLVGSLNVRYKGHEMAIKALKGISNNYDVELHFLGKGDKEKWIKMAEKYNVKDKVFFDGVLPAGEQVYKWMDDKDILFAPSSAEGLPRAVIEAMSRGCPIIGTRVGGIPELLSDNVLCDKNQYKKLEEITIKLLNDKNEMINQSNKNFNKSKRYLKNIIEERRVNFLKEATKK